jgi:metallo-beta-lactamase family protein
MKVRFLGAAQAVTGSCFIIETAEVKFAVDCGMHQGGAEIEKRNRDVGNYQPSQIDFFVITHAHIDHSGLLPLMVQNGFRGPIYTTEPTGALLKILLLDSAHIQEVDASWKSKKMQRSGKEDSVVPLYTIKDAEAVGPLIIAKNYEEIFSPATGIKVNFKDAGHILGAAILEIFVQENGAPVKLVFSGDIGRPNQLLMKDPTVVREADFLFLESTYGDRNHKGEEDSLDELTEAINFSYRNKEKVVIPAFAVERTQEILYCLHLLSKQGKLPKDMPVFLDSPLAIKATEIFRQYSSYLDSETQELINNGEDPLRLPQLKFSLTTEQSMQINELAGPAIVISASGMADAGRIKHHLRHNLWREGASIVFVGFQAEGTTGRKIVDGAKRIRILGEDIAIKARIYTINGFSAHAGQDQILQWLTNFHNKKMQIFLIHGEHSVQEKLAVLIKEKFNYPVAIPGYLEEIKLKADSVWEEIKPASTKSSQFDAGDLLKKLAQKINFIGRRKEKIKSLRPAEQKEIKELLENADQIIENVINNI